jgi:hypothetical protein
VAVTRALAVIALLAVTSHASPPPMPPCDAEQRLADADHYMETGMYAAALVHYEKALVCKPDLVTLRLALIAACGSRNAVKARMFARHLPDGDRLLLTLVCVANHIDLR